MAGADGRRRASIALRYAGPALQAAAAATVAWAIASWLVSGDDPFFAPMAAANPLNATSVDRDRNPLRMLLGVVVGIIPAELAVAAFGDTYATLALATFVALWLAWMVSGGVRLVLNQAAAGAILTVTLANGDAGVDRLRDALIGAAVALVFSTLLVVPEPVGLLRRAEGQALAAMAHGLDLAATALERGQDDTGIEATRALLRVQDRLAEVDKAGDAGRRLGRRSVVWWSHREAVAREAEASAGLGTLAASSVALARILAAPGPRARTELAPPVRVLAAALASLAANPGDTAVRQAVVARVVDAARGVDPPTRDGVPPRDGAAALGVQLIAADTLAYLGVAPDAAAAALRGGATEVHAAAAPQVDRVPFRRSR
jgi:uncharacterized membrane protein YgaE (UPF0421/DUF939 family)